MREGLANRLANEIGANGHISWHHMAHEDGAVARLRPFVLQIGGDAPARRSGDDDHGKSAFRKVPVKKIGNDGFVNSTAP